VVLNITKKGICVNDDKALNQKNMAAAISKKQFQLVNA
jgi:hypothetical protein